ncbi:MAG: tRNA (5-methylaminomethyl-2-thiouridine)(34)-methyltransferase MnmD [Bacteriovoracaceae bacterium]
MTTGLSQRSDLPAGYEEIITEDGSSTLFSTRFGEACHSTTGARAETLLHYIEGCRIKEKAQNETLTILEVGFGLGLGLLTTYEETKNLPAKIFFLSLEIDPELVKWFSETYKDHPLFHDPKFSFHVVIGDARKELPNYLLQNPVKWNAIYQDAFSPKRNPVLWTREWFTLLREHSCPDVLLSTYSASSSIRKSLVEAGWKLYAGEKFGPKRTSTRAKLTGETENAITESLARSPAKALTDKDLT